MRHLTLNLPWLPALRGAPIRIALLLLLAHPVYPNASQVTAPRQPRTFSMAAASALLSVGVRASIHVASFCLLNSLSELNFGESFCLLPYYYLCFPLFAPGRRLNDSFSKIR
ncbi:hypothetical protein C8R45DRAFT_983034 [Mycena sanguinolenta]|nr:hypothetical protein C8R45DRAFT_983034 [Mycena sanguinolenta]